MTPKEVAKVAAEAECDPRTVETYLDGGRTRKMVAGRIERALVKLRIARPSPREDSINALDDRVGADPAIVRGEQGAEVPTTKRRA